MNHFGSVAAIKKATVQEITAVPGIGATTAEAVLDALTDTESQNREVTEA